MTQIENNLFISMEDYEILIPYIKGKKLVQNIDRHNASQLAEELKKATMVKGNELPVDVVRLNSRVVVKEDNQDKLIELIVVIPEKADIKQRMISVFAPVGTALMGFRQGEKVKWNVPAGSKTFTIMKVSNSQA